MGAADLSMLVHHTPAPPFLATMVRTQGTKKRKNKAPAGNDRGSANTTSDSDATIPTNQATVMRARTNRLALKLCLGTVGLVLIVFVYRLTVNPHAPGLWSPSSTSRPPFRTGTYTPVLSEDTARKQAVVEAFKHAWRGYERDAFGYDDYHPISKSGSNFASGKKGIGYTVIDSIDTMILMAKLEGDQELKGMVNRAHAWIRDVHSFDDGGEVNTFETTIRVLGGLLAAHHLHTDPPPRMSIYLQKAIDLADRIIPSFDTPTGLPLSNSNLKERKGRGDSDNNGWCSTAEATTLQLEFKYLSHLTGNDVYWRKVENVMQVVKNAISPGAPHLVTIFMDPNSGKFVPYDIRLGSRADSYYEYLLKQYLQTNRTEDVYRQMYDDAMSSIHDHLIKRTPVRGHLYTAELLPRRTQTGLEWALSPKQDHLVCFLGGSLMLGATEAQAAVPPSTFTRENNQRDWESGKALIETCMETHRTATGLSAEITMFRDTPNEETSRTGREWYIKGADTPYPPLDARYILRPETVESLMLGFRLTGDPKYREWGWQIFQAIEKHCKLPGGGYTSIRNVDKVEGDAGREDKMETFFLSETLKYLYLLFTDSSVIPLSDYVFNTEAHPLPVFTPTFLTEIF